ncbi:hypothetical protein IG631_08379 [Alternaria alternata]|nr:hypothetical protein IG631_08379 [Alternaria alternata]
MSVVLVHTRAFVNLPVAETVPKVPPRNPVLFIDLGPVTTHIIIRSRFGASIADNRQNLRMLGSFRYLVPSIWLCYGRVGSRLLGQAVVIRAQSVSSNHGFVLCAT